MSSLPKENQQIGNSQVTIRPVTTKVFTVMTIQSCVLSKLVFLAISFTSHVLSMTNVWSPALYVCSFWNINTTKGKQYVRLIMTDYPCISVVQTGMWWNTECEMSESEVWSKHMSWSAPKWISVIVPSLLNCTNDDFITNLRMGGVLLKISSCHVETNETQIPE